MKRVYDEQTVFSTLALALVNGHALVDSCSQGVLNELQWELVSEAIVNRINTELRPILRHASGVLIIMAPIAWEQYTDGLISQAELLHHWLKAVMNDNHNARNLAFQLESLEKKLREIYCPKGCLGFKGCLMYLAD